MQTETTNEEKGRRKSHPNPLLVLLGSFLAASDLLVLVAGCRANAPDALVISDDWKADFGSSVVHRNHVTSLGCLQTDLLIQS